MSSEVPGGVLAGSSLAHVKRAAGYLLDSPPIGGADGMVDMPEPALVTGLIADDLAIVPIVTTDPPSGYARPDLLILDDVARQLASHPEIEAHDLRVGCADGRVSVAGTVESAGHKVRVEALVALIFGVRDVNVAELVVDRGIEPPDPDALLSESEGTSHAGLTVIAPADDEMAGRKPRGGRRSPKGQNG